MPQKVFRFACVFAAGAALAGCANNNDNIIRAQILGAAAGAALGGYAGAQFGGGLGRTLLTAGGAMLGAAAGMAVGPGVLETDWNRHAAAAEQTAAENPPEPRYWSNPETGRGGMIRAMQAYTDAEGRTCRAYRTTITVGDETASGNGAACMDGGGQWRVVADRFS
ncbi:MAG: RT0821/Lpp0805 family surface protein [Rhodospirillales bacterium]